MSRVADGFCIVEFCIVEVESRKFSVFQQSKEPKDDK